MGNALIKQVGAHSRTYPLVQPRVRTHLGEGALVYATEDGYLGVRLDGETRVDEYPVAWCTRLDLAAPVQAAQLAVAA